MKVSITVLLALILFTAMGAYAHDAHGKAHAPASAKSLKNPLTAAEAKPELGKEKFAEACASCHGENGKGVAKMKPIPTDLTDHKMHSMKDGEIYWVITNGIGKVMPGFKTQITDTERWQIVSYVRQLSH
jgi:mono/diheme cytochrome c family protein